MNKPVKEPTFIFNFFNFFFTARVLLLKKANIAVFG